MHILLHLLSLAMPFAERLDPLQAILEKGSINCKRNTEPILHSQSTPCSARAGVNFQLQNTAVN